MKINHFLADPFFTIPKQQVGNKDFKPYIFKLLDEFIVKIKSLQEDESEFESLPYFSFSSILERQTHLVSQIKGAINNYYNGMPAKAYQSLKEGLISDVKNFGEMLNYKTFERETDFYRIRSSKDNYSILTSDFFHIPFQIRGKVSTQRFSIPGFPSLYLGNTIYVCWEELKRPNINNFQAVRLTNKSNLNVIDLSPPNSDSINEHDYYKYLMIWPLVMACSVKVKNPTDTFKPEYIIPQLLLQWVRETSDVDGICYQTTHIDFLNTTSKGEFLNIVLPIKNTLDKGLCSSLKEKFEMTEATSFQLSEIALKKSELHRRGDLDHKLDSKIQRLEVVKGINHAYSRSLLGELEKALILMETHKIK